ncbi:TRAP transporter large permease subunit [Pseudophaeobacter leonis]|uniref:TRAP transporter large permease subunit n=1 Tax=Pseudophaeobacter leonis TaxID=1144477 RepID=UPI00240A326B|nr:TRAP transporter large permease subunit [Pseudophaeobacter leonis]
MLTFIVILLLLAALMAARVPIAFAMGITGTLGLAAQLGFSPALAVLERTFFDSSSSFILVAIPLFILMAALLTAGDVTRRAIIACQSWLGHFKGGLAIATVGASVLLEPWLAARRHPLRQCLPRPFPRCVVTTIPTGLRLLS